MCLLGARNFSVWGEFFVSVSMHATGRILAVIAAIYLVYYYYFKKQKNITSKVRPYLIRCNIKKLRVYMQNKCMENFKFPKSS